MTYWNKDFNWVIKVLYYRLRRLSDTMICFSFMLVVSGTCDSYQHFLDSDFQMIKHLKLVFAVSVSQITMNVFRSHTLSVSGQVLKGSCYFNSSLWFCLSYNSSVVMASLIFLNKENDIVWPFNTYITLHFTFSRQ